MARTQGSHATQTGPRLRRAALGLFARHGYAAVSMRRIAEETGVQVGALYNYTADKQSLLYDLMRDHLEALLAALDAEALPEEPLAALDAITRFHIRYHAERPDEVFIAYMELRNLTPENFAGIEALRRTYEDRVAAVLTRGRAEGVMAIADARVVTRALIAMLTGVNTWFRPGGRLTLEQVEEIYCDMARRLVERVLAGTL